MPNSAGDELLAGRGHIDEHAQFPEGQHPRGGAMHPMPGQVGLWWAMPVRQQDDVLGEKVV